MSWIFSLWRKLSCNVTPCTIVYHRVEGANPTETFIYFYQSNWCHIPECKVPPTRHDTVRICLPVDLSCLTHRFSYRRTDRLTHNVSDSRNVSQDCLPCHFVGIVVRTVIIRLHHYAIYAEAIKGVLLLVALTALDALSLLLSLYPPAVLTCQQTQSACR